MSVQVRQSEFEAPHSKMFLTKARYDENMDSFLFARPPC
jgi:hypothetical protein